MTSTVIVDAHAGWPIKVIKHRHPDGEVLEEHVVRPGTMQRFHIWDGVGVTTYEMPRPLDQARPVVEEVEKIDVAEGYDAEIVRATPSVEEAQTSMLETFERTLGVRSASAEGTTGVRSASAEGTTGVRSASAEGTTGVRSASAENTVGFALTPSVGDTAGVVPEPRVVTGYIDPIVASKIRSGIG